MAKPAIDDRDQRAACGPQGVACFEYSDVVRPCVLPVGSSWQDLTFKPRSLGPAACNGNDALPDAGNLAQFQWRGNLRTDAHDDVKSWRLRIDALESN